MAQVIKSLAPEMKLIAPLSPGRHEDGAPDDSGTITEAFAGYDFLADALSLYFDSTFAVHAYWGDANGSDMNRLKETQTASWYAFRCGGGCSTCAAPATNSTLQSHHHRSRQLCHLRCRLL